MIITKKARLLAAPFVGSRIRIKLDDPESLTWGIRSITLAEGHEKAVIDWGDGTKEEVGESDALTHTYQHIGEYEVRISDDLSVYRCSEVLTSSVYRTVYAPMIREIELTTRVLEAIGNHGFVNAVNLQKFRHDGSGLHILKPGAFKLCTSLAGRLDFPEVDDIGNMTFDGCLGITELHFGVANQEAITSNPFWGQTGGTFGAENATVYFDL